MILDASVLGGSIPGGLLKRSSLHPLPVCTLHLPPQILAPLRCLKVVAENHSSLVVVLVLTHSSPAAAFPASWDRAKTFPWWEKGLETLRLGFIVPVCWVAGQGAGSTQHLSRHPG